jgi:transcription initiation factor IIE alpha subunit
VSNFPDYIDVISRDESIKRHVPIAKGDLLYPLWAYNITLPIVANNSLNPLENVIYGLIENKEKYSGNIATLTGLNLELVDFIISRLQQTGLVSERMQVTELDKYSQHRNIETQYIAATVYYDIKNKAYLPKVVKEGMQVFYASKSKNKYVFNTGTSGESK